MDSASGIIDVVSQRCDLNIDNAVHVATVSLVREDAEQAAQLLRLTLWLTPPAMVLARGVRRVAQKLTGISQLSMEFCPRDRLALTLH